MENEKKLLLLAQDISIAEDPSNPVFMQIKMRVCTNAGNRNGEGVTASFISAVANDTEKYNAIPLYCDVKNLLAKNYMKLGHMYVNGKFYSTQIGSLVEFYSETDDDGITSLYATARVPKREADICSCLYELYLSNSLSFSFEVRFNPEHCIEKDGVRFITEHEDNCLTGVAVVSVPAYESAVALDLVASKHADASEEDIVPCAEQAERGECNPMEKEQITAEVTEEVKTEEVVAEAVEENAPETETVVAEGEGASESGEGASEPGGGSEASDGGDDGGDDGDSDGDVEPVIDPSEQKKTIAEDAQAEVLEHSVDTHESVENWGGEPVHVIEYHERIIETLEDAGQVIAELQTQIAELEEIKSKYDAIIAEQEAKVLAEKKAQAKAFAEKQGLNPEDVAVAEAIEALDYAKIAELSMAEAQEEVKEEPAAPVITLASFVEMEINSDNYGGLLSPRKK